MSLPLAYVSPTCCFHKKNWSERGSVWTGALLFSVGPQLELPNNKELMTSAALQKPLFVFHVTKTFFPSNSCSREGEREGYLAHTPPLSPTFLCFVSELEKWKFPVPPSLLAVLQQQQ